MQIAGAPTSAFHWYRRMRRRHRAAFTLVELMIVVSLIGALSSLAVVKYENFVCKAQQSEATGTLRNIWSVEQAVFSEHDTYDSLPVCTFGYGGFACTSSYLTIQFTGRSRYSYSVDATTTTFIATATGTTGQVLGDSITIDQTGTVNAAGSVCGR